jgi:hypothetical protein
MKPDLYETHLHTLQFAHPQLAHSRVIFKPHQHSLKSLSWLTSQLPDRHAAMIKRLCKRLKKEAKHADGVARITSAIRKFLNLEMRSAWCQS